MAGNLNVACGTFEVANTRSYLVIVNVVLLRPLRPECDLWHYHPVGSVPMFSDVNLDHRSVCPTILHIDNSRDCRELITRTLQFGGLYQLAFAEDGQSGVDRAVELLPDLILLEFRLPDMNGLDVLLQLRANVLTRDIPVMMLSAEAHTDVVARCLAAGAFDYITKPFDLHHLWHTIALVANEPSSARVVMASSAN